MACLAPPVPMLLVTVIGRRLKCCCCTILQIDGIEGEMGVERKQREGETGGVAEMTDEQDG